MVTAGMADKQAQGKGAAMNSITKRWLRSSLLITFLLVAGAVSIYIYTLISSSYNGVQQAMFSRIFSMGGQIGRASCRERV